MFGVLFGLKLAKAGEGPSAAGPAVGYSLLGLAVVPALGFAAIKLGVPDQSFTAFGVFIVLSAVGAAIAYRAWPALGRTLFAYGLAARIPVIVVMLIAILGNWGTHYDVAPPNLPEMGPIAKWFLIGVVPQLTIWIWFTTAVGAVFGVIASAATGGARRAVTA